MNINEHIALYFTTCIPFKIQYTIKVPNFYKWNSHQKVCTSNKRNVMLKTFCRKCRKFWALVVLPSTILYFHWTYLFGSTGSGGRSTTCDTRSCSGWEHNGVCCRRPLESAFHIITWPLCKTVKIRVHKLLNSSLIVLSSLVFHYFIHVAFDNFFLYVIKL